MGIKIDQSFAEKLQESWATTPFAKTVAKRFFWNHSPDKFEITQEGLREVIKESGGYRCHSVAEKHQICSSKKTHHKAEEIADQIYLLIEKLAQNKFIDSPAELEGVKDLFNSRDLFLKEGGIELVRSTSPFVQFVINGYCADADPTQVHQRFLNAHQFYIDLKNFYEKDSPNAKRFTTIDIGYFQPPGQTDKLYLTLYGGLGGLKRKAYVVRLTYTHQDNKQIIQWEIIHKPKTKSESQSELEYAVENSSADPELKKYFLEDKYSLKAQGIIAIDSLTQIATSQVESPEKYKDKFYTLASGVFNFLLYSCNDSRIHTGMPVHAIEEMRGVNTTQNDRNIFVLLPNRS